jgi:site-specific recombinase XerD
MDGHLTPLPSPAPAVNPSVPGDPADLEPADRRPAAVYLAALAPGSRRTMAQALAAIAELAAGGTADPQAFPWHLLRHPHVAAVRATLAARHRAATANKMLAALRGTLKAAWRLGLMSGDDYHRAADVPPVRASTLPRGRALEPGEARSLFAACAADPSVAGRRDAALVAVLYGCGLRRAEAAALDLADYRTEVGQVVVRGKGNQERLAHAGQGTRLALAGWLAARGPAAGPLFWPIAKGGRLCPRGMTDQAVYNMLCKRAGQAGLAHLSPHDLRRSFVSDLLDAGADVSLVRQLAGHADVGTTLRYDRRPEHAKKKACELLHVPFVEPAA